MHLVQTSRICRSQSISYFPNLNHSFSLLFAILRILKSFILDIEELTKRIAIFPTSAKVEVKLSSSPFS